jgi:hypothetical protein
MTMTMSSRMILLAAVLCSGAASVATAEQITITRISGSVSVLAAGSRVDARVGTSLATPLRIETASDGSLHIEQESSALDIGPNSIVVLPGTAPASKWEKIQQEVGRVLYSVKARKTRSFEVETPYLVSVVKGTTFSVAVDERSATVALLEGSVEVGSPDIDERLLLEPNQSARRAAGERSITVTTLDTSRQPQARAGSARSPLAQTPSEADAAPTIQSDLREITAAYSDRRAHTRTGSSPPPVAPPTAPTAETPGSPPSAPPPDTSGDAPTSGPPTSGPPSAEPSSPTDPDPVPQPAPDPGDQADADDHEHDSGDHNNGHGNDDDGEDEDNSGKGRRHRPRH